LKICTTYIMCPPFPVAARSKALVYGRSAAENVGTNFAVAIDECLL